MASSSAPEHPLPSTVYYAVEYPGYVQSSSVPLAVRNLGGQANLEKAFKRSGSKEDALLELHLRPDNPFSHPIAGDVVPTNNILLKITKRKRKRRDGQVEIIGEYKAEAVGVITKTARFRSMADFQYNPEMQDPVSKLRVAMDNLDVDSICTFRIPPEKADYMLPATSTPHASVPDQDFVMNLDPQLLDQSSLPMSVVPPATEIPSMRSNLRLFPPPIFSRQNISLAYNFKSNPTSMVSSTIDEETGEEKKRLINKMRWKGYGPATISFSDANVPDKPPAVVEEIRSQVDKSLLQRLEMHFVERPVWTRMSLMNQFKPLESREIVNSKVLLPLVCYVFQDGPWRDTLVRFGYDPRKDIEARFYQRIYLRNANHPISRPSVATRRQDRAVIGPDGPQDTEARNSHIFDGQNLTKETAAFQLCDIEDGMLKEMIETDELRDTCGERDGWYTSYALDRIKSVLRRKFFALLEGAPATDEECHKLLAANENQTIKNMNKSRHTRLRPGKHNMAKGALRPEDAAAVRLRAALDRNAKNATMQKASQG
ncbi:RNA polymerase III transcription factor IIIC subunit-domain-containing protein [Mycena floridula]|nr:RNA polymerase III transcription factor IIIC subunit-domain-containing protein [Mycena floridula]